MDKKEEKNLEQMEEQAQADFQAEDKKEDIKTEKAPKKRWYVVHTYSGHENKVKVNLEKRIEYMNMSEKIFRVEVPQKTSTQVKGGKKTEKEEKIFPGYVLVEMIMDDDSWYVVRHTAGVTKFVGSSKKPIPEKILKLKRLFTAVRLKLPKLNLMSKSAIKSESFQAPLQSLSGILPKFIPTNQNSAQMFRYSAVKHLLSWNTNKFKKYNNKCGRSA